MGKKEKKGRAQAVESKSNRINGIISRRGWRVIGVGIGVVVLGYIVLGFTDPAGKNWASHMSPFFLIGGYTAIGAGIITKDRGETQTSSPADSN